MEQTHTTSPAKHGWQPTSRADVATIRRIDAVRREQGQLVDLMRRNPDADQAVVTDALRYLSIGVFLLRSALTQTQVL
jgi:hypothetical protein